MYQYTRKSIGRPDFCDTDLTKYSTASLLFDTPTAPSSTSFRFHRSSTHSKSVVSSRAQSHIDTQRRRTKKEQTSHSSTRRVVLLKNRKKTYCNIASLESFAVSCKLTRRRRNTLLAGFSSICWSDRASVIAMNGNIVFLSRDSLDWVSNGSQSLSKLIFLKMLPRAIARTPKPISESQEA